MSLVTYISYQWVLQATFGVSSTAACSLGHVKSKFSVYCIFLAQSGLQLCIPQFRTNRLQRPTKYRGVKVWNDIPYEIKNNKSNFSTFKRIHKKYLILRDMIFAKKKKKKEHVFQLFIRQGSIKLNIKLL